MRRLGIVTLLVLGWGMCFPAWAFWDSSSDDLSAGQQAAVKAIVKETLHNPEVMMEALRSLQKNQLAKEQSRVQKIINAHASGLFHPASNPVMGNVQGDIVLVEFMDYRCGHCKTMSPVLSELIEKDKGVKLVVSYLPIFGKESEFAAAMAMAAYQQNPGKFPALHKRLLSLESNALAEDKVVSLAKAAGFDTVALKKSAKLKRVSDQIAENIAMAQKLAIMGTPAFIIKSNTNAKSVYLPGAMSLDKLRQIIAALRQSKLAGDKTARSSAASPMAAAAVQVQKTNTAASSTKE